MDEGATIPFISRYRKEMTGSMDEVQVAAGSGDLRAVQGAGKAEGDRAVGEHRAAGTKTDPGITETDMKIVPIYGNWKRFTCLINRKTNTGIKGKSERVGTFGCLGP